MTGRERLMSVLNGVPLDRLSWTTLATEATRSCMPQALREMPLLDFYRHIGCDILQLGSYGLPSKEFASPHIRRISPESSVETTENPDASVTRTLHTPWGDLKSVWRENRLVEHHVACARDMAVLKEIWLHNRYEDGGEAEAAFRKIDAALGDDGICAPVTDPSPVQQLLEFDMGVTNFYYLLQDSPKEMEDLLAAMHAARCREYELIACKIPAAVVISMENTSTTLVSPALYRRYTVPHMRDFCRIMHKHGKKAVLHMCGLLKGLMPAFTEVGLDGINALTPPTFGDVPFEMALDALGDDLIIFGGCLDQRVFQKQNATAAEIADVLSRTYTDRLRHARFVLWPVADGLPTPVERFYAVRDWMCEHGTL